MKPIWFAPSRMFAAARFWMATAMGTAAGVALYSAQAQGLDPDFAIEVNGKTASAHAGAWAIYPGRSNTLKIHLRDRGSLPARITLVRLYPDGRHSVAAARLTPDSPEASIELGLFAVPAQYDFEAGVVYRRGTRFRIEIQGASGPPKTVHLQQTIDAAGEREVLAMGAAERVVHFGKLPREPALMMPPIRLFLAPEVLTDPDDVRIQLETVEPIAGRLRVTAVTDGELLFEKSMAAAVHREDVKLDVRRWPEGRYRIEFIPEVDGNEDSAGPAIEYRRAEWQGTVPISPFAPWALVRDTVRSTIRVRDFRRAAADWSRESPDPRVWRFDTVADEEMHLVAAGDWAGKPLILRPRLQGCYAVFATTEKGHCYVRVGSGGIVRGVHANTAFVAAADLTGEEIAIYPAALEGSGLRELRLVPVTPASIAQVREITSNPPLPLRGVADWGTYFHPPPSHHSGGGRLGPDQLDALLNGHAELGLGSIAWTAGRSWVEYHSRLPDATRFPAVPLETLTEKDRHVYAGRAYMINRQDPLQYILERRDRYNVEVLPMLAMQRHYGDVYGGIFRSAWFHSHPEWRRWAKGAKTPSNNAVSYYFSAVRKERVDILCEVAARSPDGLVLDWCRQPPMILYHPDLVDEYRSTTGIDPRTIDAEDEQKYREWIRWRANFVTHTLRELKARLNTTRQSAVRPPPVAVRVPSVGLFYNLAQGLDVETWCREGLIDQIQLDPLEDTGWRGQPHDVRPYLELGHRFNIPVYGGINGNTFWNFCAILRRAAGLIRAGVDGIELYESTNYSSMRPERWLVPLLGHREALERFLESSNLEACFPITSKDACSGYDNHSFRGKWSVFGFGASSL